uniref:Uncharacterized protein n=1 Tax=Anguilla anguilla TaxID=7936 RepID=A0A0E9QQI5_ANGAN
MNLYSLFHSDSHNSRQPRPEPQSESSFPCHNMHTVCSHTSHSPGPTQGRLFLKFFLRRWPSCLFKDLD